jgi:hypothetical protein
LAEWSKASRSGRDHFDGAGSNPAADTIFLLHMIVFDQLVGDVAVLSLIIACQLIKLLRPKQTTPLLTSILTSVLMRVLRY